MNKVSLAVPITVTFRGGGVGWPAESSHTQNRTESLANQLYSLLTTGALEETARVLVPVLSRTGRGLSGGSLSFSKPGLTGKLSRAVFTEHGYREH